MKKYSYLMIGLLVASLILAACGGAAPASKGQTGSTTQSAGATDPSAQANNGQFEIPVSLKLALGTLNLDGSSNEVSAEEAVALLPLWKAVRSLGSSDTVATEEMNALYDQIQETMSSDQVVAIDEMQLTRESMTEISQKLGIELFGNGGRFGTFTPEMQATAQAARQSDQFPQGNFVPPEGGFQGGGPGGGGRRVWGRLSRRGQFPGRWQPDTRTAGHHDGKAVRQWQPHQCRCTNGLIGCTDPIFRRKIRVTRQQGWYSCQFVLIDRIYSASRKEILGKMSVRAGCTPRTHTHFSTNFYRGLSCYD